MASRRPYNDRAMPRQRLPARVEETRPMVTPEKAPDAPDGNSVDSAAQPNTLSPRARALFAIAIGVFLVLPAVVMFLLLSSGSGLSDLFNSVLSNLGKQLSGVGNQI
jgi:hypothetical protein